ncbi:MULTISPECIES: GxxExxY protein [Chitinophagaceae]
MNYYSGNGISGRSYIYVLFHSNDKREHLELKSVEKFTDIHYKQVLKYLKLTGIKLGLWINFNEVLLKNSVHRIVNGQL